jgi:D-serine deaminase-like pyridoxal phosphate-dependent protein
MDQSILDKLQTPCIVIDLEKAKANIKEMQDIADLYHCKLRPHIKTHKMIPFAKLQLKYGAAGITCAKVSEAEVMADGGIDDIFIAYPLIGSFRVKRAIELAGRVRRLILAVDSLEGAAALDEAARGAGITFEVRLEVDTGAKRTGVLRQHAVDLAKEIKQMANLNLTGIYTFKSLVYDGKPTTDPDTAGQEEGELMKRIADEIRAAGIPLTDISAGSTPTGMQAARTGMVTEIRPGTYIFKDYMLYKEGITRLEDVAAHFYATVVSTPSEEYAVIDGGTKTFPMDIQLNTAPYYYPSYAIFEENDDLQLIRMNEEHGIVTSKSGRTGLKVGQKIKLTPVHVCTAINMQNQVYLYDGQDVHEQKVDARGMLV